MATELSTSGFSSLIALKSFSAFTHLLIFTVPVKSGTSLGHIFLNNSNIVICWSPWYQVGEAQCGLCITVFH